MICLIQYFEADFQPQILNSGIILKTFTHESNQEQKLYFFKYSTHMGINLSWFMGD